MQRKAARRASAGSSGQLWPGGRQPRAPAGAYLAASAPPCPWCCEVGALHGPGGGEGGVTDLAARALRRTALP